MLSRINIRHLWIFLTDERLLIHSLMVSMRDYKSHTGSFVKNLYFTGAEHSLMFYVCVLLFSIIH